MWFGTWEEPNKNRGTFAFGCYLLPGMDWAFSMNCEQLMPSFLWASCNARFWWFLHFQLHDYDMCIKKNEEALRIDPDFAECYGNMANAWKVDTVLYSRQVKKIWCLGMIQMWFVSQEKGDIDLAIRFYCAAIEVIIWPLWSQNLLYVWILINKNSRIWQLRPRFCDAWSNLASAYMRKGMLREAEECCHQALAINPKLVILKNSSVMNSIFVDLKFNIS